MEIRKTIRFTVLLIALGLAAGAMAQADANSFDQHVNEDRAGPLYRRSVFAHGYIHGYEDGFREGDIDFQTGHDPRDVKRLKEFRSADGGYRRTFGNRDQFRAAYRRGLATGYTDALAGREFRGVAAARRAADGLADRPDVSSDNTFDHGFRQGYEAGQARGQSAIRDHVSYNSAPSACTPNPGSPPPPGQPQDFCDGYTRGYLMGYDDGYLGGDHMAERNMTAKNRK